MRNKRNRLRTILTTGTISLAFIVNSSCYMPKIQIEEEPRQKYDVGSEKNKTLDEDKNSMWGIGLG